MRPARAAIVCALLFAASLSAQDKHYGVIDLGSKGVKAALYPFVREENGGDIRSRFNKNINTKLVSSMDGSQFTAEGIRDAAEATRNLIGLMQAEAKKEKLTDVRYYVVGSSGIAKGENKGELAAAVKKATGIDMDFIDARTEGYLGLASSIPKDVRSTAIYVDIGSGNTKLGCVVGEPDVKNFRSAEIPFGSVSGRNEAAKRNPAAIVASIEQFMRDEIRPAYARKSMDTPCLRNRKRIFWTGGAAWATATMMHPEGAERAFVTITRHDVETFIARLKDGTWNQKKLKYAFPKGTSEESKVEISAIAEKEWKDVMDIFVAEDLLSGVSIMKTVLDSSNPSAEILFVREGGYLRGYALERYEEARRANN